MKLTYFESQPPNFGDELNVTMWQHLLPPGFLDQAEDELFLGIGSILWDYLPKKPMKHVMGSGYGGYSAPPDVHDGSWNVVWLRGPLTAAKLGVDPKLAITDAAVLLRATPLPEPDLTAGIAFMPHYESIARGSWQQVCALAGITFLDPRAAPDRLLAQIRGAKLLITEAMHGAIVADALRTPWIGVVPFHPVHRAKWEDWALSLGIALRQARLLPSSLLEAYTRITGLEGQGARSRAVLASSLVAPLNSAVLHLAAHRLRRLAERSEPQLSADAAVQSATERCQEALHRFVFRQTARAAE